MQTKYEHIRIQLLAAIREGTWHAGERLPSLLDLATRLGASKWATERALTLLITQGVLERRPKHGTFVCRNVATQQFTHAPVVVLGWGPSMWTNDYGGPILHAIQERLPGRNWILLTDHDPDAVVVPALRLFGVTCLIAVSQTLEHLDRLEQYPRLGMQVLCVGSHVASPHLHSIRIDNQGGVLAGVKYLAQLGHRRIAFLNDRSSMSDCIERLQAFKDGQYRYGLQRHPELIITENHPEGLPGLVSMALDRWTHLPDPPTAIVSGGGDITQQLIQECHRRGIAYPDDFSLLAFDDLPLTMHHTCPLTVIRQPLREMGHRAARALELLANPTHPLIRHICPTELIIRDSCRAPAR